MSALLTELNANSVDALTTALVTELSHKGKRAEATSDAHAERVPGSYLETETEQKDNNHTGTTLLRYSALPKKQAEYNAGRWHLSGPEGGVTDDTVLNVMRGIRYAKYKKM